VEPEDIKIDLNTKARMSNPLHQMTNRISQKNWLPVQARVSISLPVCRLNIV